MDVPRYPANGTFLQTCPCLEFLDALLRGGILVAQCNRHLGHGVYYIRFLESQMAASSTGLYSLFSIATMSMGRRIAVAGDSTQVTATPEPDAGAKENDPPHSPLGLVHRWVHKAVAGADHRLASMPALSPSR